MDLKKENKRRSKNKGWYVEMKAFNKKRKPKRSWKFTHKIYGLTCPCCHKPTMISVYCYNEFPYPVEKTYLCRKCKAKIEYFQASVGNEYEVYENINGEFKLDEKKSKKMNTMGWFFD